MAVQAQQWLSENDVLRYPFTEYVDTDFHKLVVDFRIVLEEKPASLTYRISLLDFVDISAIPPWIDAEISPPGLPVLNYDPAEVDPPESPVPNYTRAQIIGLLTGNIEVSEVISSTVVFSGTLTNAYIWGPNNKWVTFTAKNETGSLVIVIKYENLLTYSGIVPAETTLIDSVVEGKAKNVRRLFIQNVPGDNGKVPPPYGSPGTPLTLIPITDRVVFQGGYNTAITLEDTADTLREEGQLNISMAPGGGIGKFVLCDQAGIKTINNVAPDNSGDLKLTPSGTLSYERTDALDNLLVNDLRIRSSSNPCCSCADYIDAYVALSNEYNLARRVGYRLRVIRDLYAIIRDKMIQEKAAREAGLKIKTNLHIRPGRTVAVMSEVRNASPNPLLLNTVVKFTITGGLPDLISGSGILVTSTALRDTTQVDPTQIATTFEVYLGQPLAGYAWIQFTFQMKFLVDGPINCVTIVNGYPVVDTSTIYVRNI